ncbi:nucleoside 2-deoxyribosyltransferase domain-containing protein [Aquimarina pacifica]|uniref:nucleoside 2-deoxyribosyltransferase domain-containing protein n=1 Tax=Aquimarina pacifica TaxID=1296415 RepID=UPI000470514F|nr:nucleoside 2-deoxyribosyltransferase domain-containing protein [Aquimarina pacifica]
MRVITAIDKVEVAGEFSVFLAGSVQSADVTEKWRTRVIKKLSDEKVTLIDPVWVHNGANLDYNDTRDTTKINKQVGWELDALERVDMVIMYLDEASKSPISLLELGLYAQSGKLVVCCADGFWRKGNVDVVCERYGVAQVADLDELVSVVKKKLK